MKFEDLTPTTMTAVVTLNGEVYIDLLFPMLPIYRFNASIDRRRKKVTIPHPGVAGKILTARCRGNTRGIAKGTGYFKNSIMIDISTTKKNVNMKLMSSSIQMCGPTSEAMIDEAAEHLLGNVDYVQQQLDYANAFQEESKATAEWVLNNSKGDTVTIDSSEHNSIVIPNEYYTGYPSDIDAPFADFLIEMAPDYILHRDYTLQINWVLKQRRVASIDLSIDKAQTSMVNYNFYLGFEVDRRALCNAFDKDPEFSARYFNATDHAVFVIMPYVIPDHLVDKIRKRNEKRNHSFLVYRSGNVTQSGPNIQMNATAFKRFMKVIEDHKSVISI